MHSNNNRFKSRDMHKEGREIWVYYETSAQNDPKQWLKATVEEATP